MRFAGVILGCGVPACLWALACSSFGEDSARDDAGSGSDANVGDARPPDATSPVEGGCAGYALDLTPDQHLEVEKGAAEFDAPAPRTVEAWIKLRAKPAKEMFIVAHDEPDGFQGWSLLVAPGPDLVFRVFGAGAPTQLGGSGSKTHVPVGQWTHVAVTYELRFAAIFIDGAEVARSVTFPTADSAAMRPVRIGASATIKNELFGFDGLIDEARLSTNIRYIGNEGPPARVPFVSDPNTIALWHFDEPNADATDSSGHNHPARLGTVLERIPKWICQPSFLAP